MSKPVRFFREETVISNYNELLEKRDLRKLLKKLKKKNEEYFVKILNNNNLCRFNTVFGFYTEKKMRKFTNKLDNQKINYQIFNNN